MSTCYSKHVEENIWRINNIECITLVFCMINSWCTVRETLRSYIVFCLWKEVCFAKYFTCPSPNLYNAVCPHTKKWWSSWKAFKGWEVCAQILVAYVMECPQMNLLKLLKKWKSAVLILIDLLQHMFFYFTHILYQFIDKLCPMNIQTATDVLITLLTLKN